MLLKSFLTLPKKEFLIKLNMLLRIKTFIFFLVFVFSLSSAYALSECDGSPVELIQGYEADNWDNCIGTLITFNKGCERCKYIAIFRSGAGNGKSMEFYPNGKILFVGYSKDGFREGLGTHVGKDGFKYKGNYLRGFIDGKGYMILGSNSGANVGDKYIGNFKGGKYSGYGKYYFKDGKVWEGNWDGHEKFTGQKYAANQFSNYDEEYYTDIQILESVDTYFMSDNINDIEDDNNNNNNIENAKQQCLEIGFKKNTEGYGECVLELLK